MREGDTSEGNGRRLQERGDGTEESRRGEKRRLKKRTQKIEMEREQKTRQKRWRKGGSR